MFIDNNLITPLCFPTKPLNVLCVSVTESFSKFLSQLNISCIWNFIFIQSARQKRAFLSSYFLSLLGTISSDLWVCGVLTVLISSTESSQDAALPLLIWCYTQFLSINEINSRQQGSSYRYEQLPHACWAKCSYFCAKIWHSTFTGEVQVRECKTWRLKQHKWSLKYPVHPVGNLTPQGSEQLFHNNSFSHQKQLLKISVSLQ